jgi:hypothetical protein
MIMSLTDEQKENIRHAVDKYVTSVMDDQWQETLDACTDTQEEFEWAYEHLYIGEVDFKAD